jgi:hypothetical protein
MSPNRRALVISWALQVAAAAILAQTLYFKFTGAEESRYIFETLGVEPWGRLAAGAAELVAAVLLLIPRTAAIGAVTAVSVISWAIGAHLTKLGIEVKCDGGLLFALAVAVLVSSVGVAVIRRRQLLLITRLRGRVRGAVPAAS